MVDEKDPLEDLKKLTPRERIERLKKLGEQKKKELSETEKLLQESMQEVERQESLAKRIDLPEMRSPDITRLFTPQEEEVLESIIERQRPREHIEPQKAQYIIELSQEPTQTIYSRIRSMYEQVMDAGHMSEEQREHFSQMDYALQQKAVDIKSGNYLPSKDASRQVIASIELAEKMKDLYRA